MHAPTTGPGNYQYQGPVAHPAQLEAEQLRDEELRETATRYHTQRVLDAIAAGKTLFTRTATGWAIVGPTSMITPGELVTVTRHDSGTNTVRATIIRGNHDHNGLAYTVAAYQPVDGDTYGVPVHDGADEYPGEYPGSLLAPALRKLAFGLGFVIGRARRNLNR